ncbi:succinylglutamate desuccinylase/aspartoacylase family protein [Microvirga alba]|uniref:Succinylglutamate desuccinylase/aspartoacylase family protein n=1 Tax=Microvirga alba TaxID=2791025 RepID=A0A931FPX9_9HYPH|nr:succinylglutamate desuccinylase/aspartoacylase family protein [Microvirga alba]MBF9235414.1 succinylglutamate desuccinylase/aspartoacylase family protein [Microvirga alba]
MHKVEEIEILQGSFGTSRRLQVHRFGDETAGPKVYIQAALHADETPAMLAAHHLLQRLIAADKAGEVLGQIVVVPFANPIGLGQRMLNMHIGRGDLGGGGNFNRNFPDIAPAVIERLQDRFGSDAAENDRIVRGALRDTVADLKSHSELAALRIKLLQLAVDANIVLDLHCHFEGITYLYCNGAGWPSAEDLSAQVQSHASLIATGGGGGSFDESCELPWVRIKEAFPDVPLDHGCLSVTLEYRGQADVTDEFAAFDADALIKFMQRRGVLAGDPGPLPDALCQGTPVDAVDHVRSPVPGIIVHKVALGDKVKEGQVVAEIVSPDAPLDAPRTVLRARTDGIVFGRLFSRIARPGTAFLSIAGTDPAKVPDNLGDPYP